MDILSLVDFFRETFIVNLSYNLTFISVLFLVSHYSATFFKHFIKNLRIGVVGRFAAFTAFLIFGTSPVLVFLTNSIMSVADFQIKWAIIIGLLIWSFIEFDADMAKLGK
jgi:hypothetical protein